MPTPNQGRIYARVTPLQGGGYDVAIALRVGDKTIKLAHATARKEVTAVQKAADIATRIASNPVMATLLPPGAGPALKVAAKLATYAKTGEVGKYLRAIKGAGGKRIRALFHL